MTCDRWQRSAVTQTVFSADGKRAYSIAGSYLYVNELGLDGEWESVFADQLVEHEATRWSSETFFHANSILFFKYRRVSIFRRLNPHAIPFKWTARRGCEDERG